MGRLSCSKAHLFEGSLVRIFEQLGLRTSEPSNNSADPVLFALFLLKYYFYFTVLLQAYPEARLCVLILYHNKQNDSIHNYIRT